MRQGRSLPSWLILNVCFFESPTCPLASSTSSSCVAGILRENFSLFDNAHRFPTGFLAIEFSFTALGRVPNTISTASTEIRMPVSTPLPRVLYTHLRNFSRSRAEECTRSHRHQAHMIDAISSDFSRLG